MNIISRYKFKPSEIESWDRNFPIVFEEIKRLILSNTQTHLEIEHIGSTAVTGIKCKPIIDILIPCKKSNFEKILIDLEKIGFQKTPFSNIPEDRPMKVGGIYYENKFYNIHIHLTPVGSDVHLDNIFFRDELGKNKQLSLQYESIKEKAIKEGKVEATEYNVLKHDFIQSVIQNRKNKSNN